MPYLLCNELTCRPRPPCLRKAAWETPRYPGKRSLRLSPLTRARKDEGRKDFKSHNAMQPERAGPLNVSQMPLRGFWRMRRVSFRRQRAGLLVVDFLLQFLCGSTRICK